MKRHSLAIVAVAVLFVLGTDIRASHPTARTTTSSKKIVVYTRNVTPVRTSSVAHAKTIPARYYVRQYRGWNNYCYFPRQCCYGFYDPQYRCWFYWYEPLARFMPIEYVATYPPQTNGANLLPPGVSNVTTPTGPTLPVGTQAVPNSLPTGTAAPMRTSVPIETPTPESAPGEQ